MKRVFFIFQVTVFLTVGFLSLTSIAFSADKPTIVGSDVLTSEKFGKAFVEKINKKKDLTIL